MSINWKDLVTNLLPRVLMFVPGIPAVLVPAIVDAINEAEAIPGADGPTKKAHVLTVLADAITAFNSIKGREVLNATAILSIADGAIDTAIKIVNLLHKKA